MRNARKGSTPSLFHPPTHKRKHTYHPHSSLIPKDQALFFDAVAGNILTGKRDDLSLVVKARLCVHTYVQTYVQTYLCAHAWYIYTCLIVRVHNPPASTPTPHSIHQCMDREGLEFVALVRARILLHENGSVAAGSFSAQPLPPSHHLLGSSEEDSEEAGSGSGGSGSGEGEASSEVRGSTV